jgi:hypothetical protein
MQKPFFDTIGTGSFFNGSGGGNENGNLVYICQIAGILNKNNLTPVDKINELGKIKKDIEIANPGVTLPPCACNQSANSNYSCNC